MRRNDLYASRVQFERLVATNILSAEGSQTPWFEPVITKLLILLSDLLKAADKIGQRYRNTDDIGCIDDELRSEIRDVTDLVIRCRNACCHISSGNQIFETNKFSFCVIFGRNPNCFSITGKEIGSDYDDDIAVLWGPMRLYLKRNMLMAYDAVAGLFPDPYSHNNIPTNFSNR